MTDDPKTAQDPVDLPLDEEPPPSLVQRFAEFVQRPIMTAVAVLVVISMFGLSVYLDFSLKACVTDYNEAKARRDAKILVIADEDRALDLSDRKVDDQIAAATRKSQRATLTLLVGLGAGDREKIIGLFADMTTAYSQLEQEQDAGVKTRLTNAKKREDLEKQRKANPLPAPPSQRC